MSIRTEDIPASAQVEIDGEVYPVVTLEDLQQAMIRAAVVLDLCGGCMGFVLERIPTNVPNEKLTTRALMTWQERTNARPQPETTAPVAPAPAIEPAAEIAEEPEAEEPDETPAAESRPDIFAQDDTPQAVPA